MPINRLERNEILMEGLDMVDSSELDRHDRPNGAIVDEAFSIQWLQRALDRVHQEFPWSGTVTVSSNITIAAGALNIADYAPADFVRDFRNGVVIEANGTTLALARRSHAEIFDSQIKNDQASSPITERPSRYVFSQRILRLDITTDQAYTSRLYYYALPAVLDDGTVPNFPSDDALVEYIWVRGLEWARARQPGSARAYLDKLIGDLRSAGLDQEPEDNYLRLDPQKFRTRPGRPYDWMGSTRPNL